jgi:L-alanine-DL-glutamate epimerase-like enolase superfamily enzyme
VRARLRAPFVSANGTVETVALGLVSLSDEGTVGYGESIDAAQWDLAGRLAGQPVWQLLGAKQAPAVEVNATIAAPDRASASSAAAAARDAGYRCIKVKVGLGDDAGRLAAVRAAAGSEMAIRLDANGAWTASEALAALRAFEPVGIELCEQPAADLDACAEVASASPIPIALDESAPESLDERVCDAVCLKVARFAGISGVVFAARRARQAGYRVYLASMLDGPLGIAAALHAAVVVQPDYACGLATLGLFDGRPDPLPPSGGRIRVPAGPGLGEGLIDWY